MKLIPFLCAILCCFGLIFCCGQKAWGINIDDLKKRVIENQEAERQAAANSPVITYRYTVIYDNNNGSGTKDNEIIEAKMQHETVVQYPSYAFPDNPFNPPLFHKFSCWRVAEMEYPDFYPGDRINLNGFTESSSFSDSSVKVTAIWEIDWLSIFLSCTIFVIIIIICIIVYWYVKKNYKRNFPKNNKSNNSSNDLDFDEKIKKFKKLLDEGIITKEEFNKKKKEILNL